MKYRTVFIIGIIFTALILNAIFTWGIVFDCDGGFEWSQTSLFKDIVSNGYAHVKLEGEFDDTAFSIPLVFYVEGIESPPYAINLFVRDNARFFKKFFMESVEIEYVDGHKIKHNLDWEREFENAFPNMPERYVHDILPVTVDRRKSCRFRFVGYFVNKEGEKIPFDTVEYFEYEAHKWRVYPLAGSF